MKKKGWIIAVAVLAASAVYLLYAFLQPTYTYSLLDPRFDAHQYAKIYTYFKGFTVNYEVAFPFNTRILMPWLAAHLPFDNLTADFIWLNGVFVVMTAGLLTWIWLKLNIRPFWIAIALFWILFHWKGLVRMYVPDPVTADVGGYFWLTSLLTMFLLQEKKGSIAVRNWVIIGVITVLGTLQKESFIAVMGVAVVWGGLNVWLVRTPTMVAELVQTPTTIAEAVRAPTTITDSVAFRMIKPLLFSFCLSLAVYCIVVFFFPSVSSDWRNNSIVSVLRGMKRYVGQPELFLRVPVSWFLAFGTFWLALFSTPKPLFLPTSRFSLLAPHVYLWLFLSVFGGGDTTRILFNGMPFVLTYLLVKLNQQPKWLGWYILMTSLPLMRLNALEPDLGLYPNEMHQWCVECWTLAESWGYWTYVVAVLAGYYYLSRRFGAVGSNETNEVKAHR